MPNNNPTPSIEISTIEIPDSKLTREVAQFIRDTETDLLFRHSSRVYFWAALTALRRTLTFDRELLYTAAMFHDIGLTHKYSQSRLRFEVDGAITAARTCNPPPCLQIPAHAPRSDAFGKGPRSPNPRNAPANPSIAPSSISSSHR